MKIFSSKTMTLRDSKITLSSDWGGIGILGVSIRYCSIEGADKNVWHVLDVHPKSPAAFAHLNSHTDYIIGSDVLLEDEASFYQYIEENDGKVVKLYVYDSIKDDCREIMITPNSKWGGAGLLGCDIGYGYLHRIPAKLDQLSDNSNETVKDIETQNLTILPQIEQVEIKNEGTMDNLHCSHDCSSHNHEHKLENVPLSSPEIDNTSVTTSNVALPGMPPLDVPLQSIPLTSNLTSVMPDMMMNNMNYNYNCQNTNANLQTSTTNMPPLQNPLQYQQQQLNYSEYSAMPPMQNHVQSYYNSNNMMPLQQPIMNHGYSDNYGQNYAYQNAMPMPTYHETPTYTQTPNQAELNTNQGNNLNSSSNFNYVQNLGI